MKTIELTQGEVAIVDDADYDYLSQWNWSLYRKTGRRSYYAQRSMPLPDGRKTTIQMHRHILSAPIGVQIDHVNGNGLDNQRCNLRLCTHAENRRNMDAYRNCTSGYKGVHWHRQRKKWRAVINYQKKSISLGLYKNKEEAAIAYDEAAKKYFGKFA